MTCGLGEGVCPGAAAIVQGLRPRTQPERRRLLGVMYIRVGKRVCRNPLGRERVGRKHL